MRKITFFARLKNRRESPGFEIYTDKLAESARNIIRESYQEARRLNHDRLNSEHALTAFANLQPEVFDSLLHAFGLDRQTVLRELSTGPVHPKRDSMRIEESFRRLLSDSLRRARGQGRRRIEASDILVAIFEDAGSLPVKVFAKAGIDRETALDEVNRLVMERK